MLASRVQAGVARPAQNRVTARTAPVMVARRPAVQCRAAAEAEAVVVAGKKEGEAHLNFQRGSVFKVRRVLDVIRGRSYEESMMLMEYLPYKSCESIVKALKSAAANAKENAGASKARLVVGEAFADQGPHMRRFRCRAQGRGFKILKPTFHLTIRLEEKGEEAAAATA